MRRLTASGLLSLCLVAGMSLPARAADIENVLPNDTEFVMSFNIKQLLDSAIVKKYASDMIDQAVENSPEAQQFMELTGLDPRKDLTRIIMAGSGSDPSDMSAVVLMEGNYDPTKLNAVLAEVARAKSEMISVIKDGNLTLYKIEGPESPTPLFAHVANKSLVVMATSKDLVKDTLAKTTGAKKGGVSKELSSLLGRVKDDASMYMIAVVKGKTDNIPIPNPDVAKIVENIETVSLSLNLTADVAIDLGVGVNDEDAAKELGDQLAMAIPQAKSFVQLFAIQQPKLKKPLNDIVTSLKSGVNGKVVSLKVNIPASAVDALINAAREAQGGN